MRRPLKFQIMLPMMCVMLVTLILFSALDIWLARRRAGQHIEKQLRDIAATLTHSTFPLTDRVLNQMRGLSGADFVVAYSDGGIVASSDELRSALTAVSQRDIPSELGISLNRRVRVNNVQYFHVPVTLNRGGLENRPAVLHCFYPELHYQQALREAAVPPLVLGGLSLLMVIVISTFVASRVTRRIRQVCHQVEQIARGEFSALKISNRDDELRDLAIAVNRMSNMLAQYEDQVRANERLRTLDQLGGGIAHQLRNSVTGCRMAVDLHRRHCPVAGDQSVHVAVAQLELMEKYLRRFLAIGKRSDRPFEHLEISEVIEGVLPLIRPRSDHLGVAMEWRKPNDPMLVYGDPDALSEVVVNLLLNATEATAERYAKGNNSESPLVEIHVQRVNDIVQLEVFDSGDGPNAAVQNQLFEPLVSGKHDGVGLGLAIVRDIVGRHGGSVGWRRTDEMTCFIVELPALAKEIGHVQIACS